MKTIKQHSFRKLFEGFLNKLTNKVFVTAFADEQDDMEHQDEENTEEELSSSSSSKSNKESNSTSSSDKKHEDMVAKARKEEREKLYKDIEKWKGRANSHLEVIAAREEEIETLRSEVKKLEADLEKAKADIGNKANKTKSESQAVISALEKQVEDLESSLENQKKTSEVELYRLKKIYGAKDEVIEEMVVGNTVEEIDQSFEKAKERFQSIRNSVMQGVTYPAPKTSSTIPGKLSLSLDDLASLDPRSPEYAELRKEIFGLK